MKQEFIRYKKQKNINLTSQKHKKVCRALTFKKAVRVGNRFASLVGCFVGISSSVVELKTCVTK